MSDDREDDVGTKSVYGGMALAEQKAESEARQEYRTARLEKLDETCEELKECLQKRKRHTGHFHRSALSST